MAKTHALTREEIVGLVGHLNSTIITAIAATGATSKEVAEAQRLAAKSDQPIPPPQVGGRVAIVHKVYDLLRTGMPDIAERDR